jgi:hypothetical protein
MMRATPASYRWSPRCRVGRRRRAVAPSCSLLNQLSLFSQDFALDIQYLKSTFQALHDACPLQDPGFTNRSRPCSDNHHRHPTVVAVKLAYPRIQRTKFRRFDPPRHFIWKPKPRSVQVLCEPPGRRLRLTHITHISNRPRIRERVDRNAARAVTGVIIELRTNMATHARTDRCLIVPVRIHLPTLIDFPYPIKLLI